MMRKTFMQIMTAVRMARLASQIDIKKNLNLFIGYTHAEIQYYCVQTKLGYSEQWKNKLGLLVIKKSWEDLIGQPTARIDIDGPLKSKSNIAPTNEFWNVTCRLRNIRINEQSCASGLHMR